MHSHDGSHEIKKPWEVAEPENVPQAASVKPTSGGGLFDPFFAVEHVDDVLLARVQHGATNQVALIAPASLASDYMRLLFGQGEAGVNATLLRRKIHFEIQR